jgi:alpha-1,6-mannosyltransferase
LEAAARIVLSYLALGLGLLAAALMSRLSLHTNPDVNALFVLAAVMLGCALTLFFSPHRLRLNALAVLAVLHVIALFGRPLFEDDHYRYLWDGYQSSVHGSPYGVIPEDAFLDSAVPENMQRVLSGINHPELATIYGAVPQYLFAAGYQLHIHSGLDYERCYRALLALLHVLALAFLLHRYRLSHQRYLWLYVLNPLTFKEIALTGHFDVLFALPLLVLCLRMRQNQGSVSSSWGDGFCFALCLASRSTALLLLPLFVYAKGWYRSVHFCIAALALLVALYLPLRPSTNGSELASLLTFAQQWEFNAGFFALSQQFLGRHGAMLLSAALGGVVLLVCLRALHHKSAQLPLTGVILLAGQLLLGPVLNPWYWLWLLPLGFALDRAHLQLWLGLSAALLLLSYGHGMLAATLPAVLRNDSSLAPYEIPTALLLLQHLPIWLGGLALMAHRPKFAASRLPC